MKICWIKRVLTALLITSFSGCAHYPVNAPKIVDTSDGQYQRNHTQKNNSDEIIFLMAFSVGGTRAASFSYGLLEALRDTTYKIEDKTRRLLDEVDVISSVSGGSVTSAAYAL